MQNFIFLHVQSHLSILEVALQSSLRMKNHAAVGDIKSFETESIARDQIMGVLEQLQEDIEEQVDGIKSAFLAETLLPIVRSWINDSSIIFDLIGSVDSECLAHLNDLKDGKTSEMVSRLKSATSTSAHR